MTTAAPAVEDFRAVLLRKREELRELEHFASVCDNALHQATKAVRSVELQREIASHLGEPPPFENDGEFEKAKSHASAIAKFAEAEKSAGLPYLFGLCAVRLWALMEALVDELVVEAMRQPERCKDQAALSRLKGPLVEFRAASSDEQAEFLAETLKQSVDAALKLGVGRFEAILDPVGLGGPVDDSIRKSLFELSQIRNVIVHKGGKADRRLVDGCAWLGLQRGAIVRVGGAMFARYRLAAYWYLIELRGRVDERFGGHRPVQEKHAHELLLRDIAKQVEGEETVVPASGESSLATGSEPVVPKNESDSL
jgi:hypothetical protein